MHQKMSEANKNATGNADALNNQAAYDEAQREYELRCRLYPRWVAESKISRTQARTQLDAQARICKLLAGLPDVTANAEKAVDGVAPF